MRYNSGSGSAIRLTDVVNASPRTDVMIRQSRFSPPAKVPTSEFNARLGDTVTVKDVYTVRVGGSNGFQDAYYGTLEHNNIFVAEWEYRVTSELLVIRVERHVDGPRIPKRLRKVTPWFNIKTQGPSTDGIWRFACEYAIGDTVLVEGFNGGAERAQLSDAKRLAAELRQIRECEITIPALDAMFVWFPPGYFNIDVGDEVDIEMLYPLVEAYERHVS